MAAATLDITIEQGATWRQSLTWYQPDGVTPYDLTGAQARLQLRSAHGTAVLVDLNEKGTAGATLGTDGVTPVSDGQIALGGATGTIDIVMLASATERLNLRKAAYDLTVKVAAGDTDRVLEGKVTIKPSITEPTSV